MGKRGWVLRALKRKREGMRDGEREWEFVMDLRWIKVRLQLRPGNPITLILFLFSLRFRRGRGRL